MRTVPDSELAARARTLVEGLQTHFVDRLADIEARQGGDRRPQPVEWLRDDGRHGGGVRYVIGDSEAFDRASVNVSVVHYDDLPEKRLGSATALSCIVHPRNPRAPSMHMHISWTEMRDGSGYWRIMADLNPSIPVDADRDAFQASLRAASGDHYADAAAQGDRYFSIPALERHRGVAHFYMEGFHSGDFEADRSLAETVGRTTIDTYHAILVDAVQRPNEPGDVQAQRAYHTLYLFQVLTLDRGTTSGLLVHDQNDVGILGSLPSTVDVTLLRAWKDRVPDLQKPLVEALADGLGDGAVTTARKQVLANRVRDHYRAHPEALKLQASGDIVPPTVANHR
jgi:coproporphyrinogen III oxidase